MTRRIFGCLLIALCGLAGPAFAETAYVPVVATDTGDTTFETRVMISNTGAADSEFRTYFIPSDTDGVDRPDGAGQGVVLLGGATFRTEPEAKGLGIFEIASDDDQLAYHARMVGQDAGGEILAAEIPVITSRNAIPAGQTAHLQGWVRNFVRTDFGLINLGSGEAECRIDIRRADGLAIATGITGTWQPLSQRHFPDALGLLGLDQTAQIRAAITCDQTFYPYAVILDPETGVALFIEPSASSGNGLSDPGDDDFVYLSDIGWSRTDNVRHGPNRDRTGFDPHAPGGEIGGYKAIEINGVTYAKGISWFPHWGNSWVEWALGGQYQRFQATVRIDDEKFGRYEWGLVNRSNGNFIRIQRPPEGFRGPERDNNFRIGGGARIRILGDGKVLFESGEFYAYGPSVDVDIDVRGVNVMRILLIGTHHEQAGAPHRRGLRSTPALVVANTFHDMVCLADAKLILE